MRVLHLIDSIVGGGAETSLASMAPHLVGAGVDLHVGYLKESPGLHRSLRSAGASIHSLGGGRTRLHNVGSCLTLIRSLTPDLVHTTLFEADVAGRTAGRLAGTRVVSSLVNDTYGPEHFADPRLSAAKLRGAQFLDAATARLPVRFHALSTHVAAVLRARLLLGDRPIEVIPRGRDPELLGRRDQSRRERARRLLGLDDHTPLVLSAARHEHQKGLDRLLDAFPAVVSEIPDARLVIAGREGNRSAALREQARSPHLAGVHFVGHRTDLPELLCAADVFVIPSRWEGLGSVAIEAMALEAPLVCSDLPPLRELVGDTALFTSSTEDLGRAIVEALSDRSAAVRRSSIGRERFLERFTESAVSAAMVQFYGRALDAPQSSSKSS